MNILRKSFIPILIVLLFTGLVGCKTTISNDPPIVSLKASTDRGVYPLDVTFDISNSRDPDGDIAAFELDFGDGSAPLTGSGDDIFQPITHTYQKEGEFKVSLALTDDSGETKQASLTPISVKTPPNQFPTVTITSPSHWASFEHGANIVFTATVEDPEDGALNGTSLVWTSDRDGQIGTGETFSRNDLSGGSHRITLVATDSEGATAQDEIRIWIDLKPNECE